VRQTLNTCLLLAFLSISGCTLQQENELVERSHYNSWEADIGYTQVVRSDNTLYLSGITSSSETFDGQLEEIYTTIMAILADYRVDSTAVVKETIYTRDIEALKKAIPLRKQFYPNGQYPSSTWVQVERLFMPDHLIEVEVIALMSGGAS
jgi:2-iminobutanoate/2-iminopropanoate deaminase